MDLEERLQLILLRIKKLKTQFQNARQQLQQLEQKNKELKEENEALKKINFEQKKKIDIAGIANQLSDKDNTDQLKRQVDKYIREVDAVIEALKRQEE